MQLFAAQFSGWMYEQLCSFPHKCLSSNTTVLCPNPVLASFHYYLHMPRFHWQFIQTSNNPLQICVSKEPWGAILSLTYCSSHRAYQQWCRQAAIHTRSPEQHDCWTVLLSLFAIHSFSLLLTTISWSQQHHCLIQQGVIFPYNY